jgi:hydroxymethylbilane synthase
MSLRLGTRASTLALAQARLVADELRRSTGEPVELVEIATAGDRSTAAIAQLGVGVFVSTLRDALLAKEIDLAVHSYKDLPTAPVDGLRIAAVPAREDARDALVSRDGSRLAELPAGAVVGTGAVRRIAQLLLRRQGLVCRPARGNMDTRLVRLAAGEFDALIIAVAGLHRLGRAAEITELLDPAMMLPAPAQGALAVECRDEGRLVGVLAPLDDRRSRLAVTAERSLLSTLEAGCSAPVAALAEASPVAAGGWRIELRGAVFSPDGSVAIRDSRGVSLPAAECTDDGLLAAAEETGRTLAANLLGAGADQVLGVRA